MNMGESVSDRITAPTGIPFTVRTERTGRAAWRTTVTAADPDNPGVRIQEFAFPESRDAASALRCHAFAKDMLSP